MCNGVSALLFIMITKLQIISFTLSVSNSIYVAIFFINYFLVCTSSSSLNESLFFFFYRKRQNFSLLSPFIYIPLSPYFHILSRSFLFNNSFSIFDLIILLLFLLCLLMYYCLLCLFI